MAESCELDVANYSAKTDYLVTNKTTTKTSDHLAKQSILEDLNDLLTLTPLTPAILSRQATMNIGTIGHVAHGKSTLVNALSGVKTVRFKRELIHNITIKLGYANAKIFQCPTCPKPDCFFSSGSASPDTPQCPKCNDSLGQLIRHVSFVDCPGHQVLMATMLNGTAVMDAALLLIAGNEVCPQPQTSEHLSAIEMVRFPKDCLIICQNKVDLVKQDVASHQLRSIKDFIHGTTAEDAPVIPMSAQLGCNIDALLERIVKIPLPVRDFVSPGQMVVIRSFDVNRPGEEINNLQGGVVGGTIIKGVLRIGEEVEILPGVLIRRANQQISNTVLRTTVCSLMAEGNSLQYAVPGGLIGVGTSIDSAVSRGDRLVGNVLGKKGHLPPVLMEIEIEFVMLSSLIGVSVKTGESVGGESGENVKSVKGGESVGHVKSSGTKVNKVQRIQKDEILSLNVGSMSTGGKVVAIRHEPTNRCKIMLHAPVCADIGSKIAISRKIDRHWRLIGWGKIRGGVTLETIRQAAADAAAEAVPHIVKQS